MSRGFTVLVCLAVFFHSGLTALGAQIITSA
jgi:hypothetical protein